MPSAAAGDADTGPRPTTATAGQGKVLAEHGRRSGRHALVGEASSSEAECAGGQERGSGQGAQVVRVHGAASATGRDSGLWPARQSALASQPGW